MMNILMRALLAALEASGRVLAVEREWFLHPESEQRLRSQARAALEEFHRANPLKPGMSREELRRRAGNAEERVFTHVLTRLDADKTARLKRLRTGLKFHPTARAATWVGRPIRITGKGVVLVVCAGTSDIPVAEEALITAKMMGNQVEKLFDVGVAGIHRLLDNRARLADAAVIIVVAGMEGALPSVVAGLIDKPVIAVPTSIGYGASFNGLSALLGMLNSCAGGVTVVNIDNGFGAGFAASLINRV